MPWTVKDVESKKKGLSEAKKKSWVKIANKVRADCLKKGSSEKDCDAKAIRIANSQVNTSMQINFETLSAYTPRNETHEGKDYLVVPVVMLVEGVHSGSRGPVYHSPDEFGKIVDTWNGIPVTLMHPVNDEGEFVPANSPDVLSSFAVGRIFNTFVEGDKLKAEAWLDIQKMTAVSPQTLQMVQKGEMIEVSVGIFSEEEEVEGDWNDEHYIGIVKNYRPNHLALLPGEVGACSTTDGCGFRVNKKGGKSVNLGEIFNNLSKQGYVISPLTNEASFEGIMDQIYMLTEGMSDDTVRVFPEQIYKDYFVYRKRRFNNSSDGEVASAQDVALYKQNYQIGADDKVSLVGDAVEVKKEVTYVTLQQSQTTRKRTKFNNNKKEDNMACEKCPEKVEGLINNSATHFNESDREWLGELNEDKLDKLIPKKDNVTVNKNNNQNKPKVTEQEAWDVLQLNKSQYEVGVKIYNDQRAEVTKEILDNCEKDTWKEEDLKELKLDVLKKVAKSFHKKGNEEGGIGNYAGMGAGAGGNGQGSDEEEAPYIPEIEFAEKK